MRIASFVLLAAVFALHLFAIPLTIWEYDENLFAMGVERYEPLLHHPPPPGAPLYIGAAKLLYPFCGDAFRTLVVLSVITTGAGLLLFAAAFRAIGLDPLPAAIGSALFYLSPSMLVHGTVALADSGALALMALAIWFSARAIADPTIAHSIVAALAGAAAVGWRPQFSIAVVPLFAVTLLMTRSWRARFAAAGAFTAGCLAWLIPLMAATGGIRRFLGWIGGQAGYYAAHDAHLSRSGITTLQLLFRFLAHAWGPKLLALPVLALAAIGLVVLLRRRERRLLPVIVMAAVYFTFALLTMDPADAVRYTLPALPAVALLAAASLSSRRLAIVALACVIGYGAASRAYTNPIIRDRTTGASPPVAAAAFIRQSVPRDAVILYDPPLRPHADNLLRDYRRMRTDEALMRFGARLEVPLVAYADGALPGKVFSWSESDAYGKLTRNFYRVVTVQTLAPAERYQPLSGLYPPERSHDGKSWRWIGPAGTILLPDVGARRVAIALRLPPEYPLEGNRVTLSTSAGSAVVDLRRGESAIVEVPLSRGPSRLTLTPQRSFVPADIAGSRNRDPRRLSVMLTEVRQSAAPPAP